MISSPFPELSLSVVSPRRQWIASAYPTSPRPASRPPLRHHGFLLDHLAAGLAVKLPRGMLGFPPSSQPTRYSPTNHMAVIEELNSLLVLDSLVLLDMAMALAFKCRRQFETRVWQYQKFDAVPVANGPNRDGDWDRPIA